METLKEINKEIESCSNWQEYCILFGQRKELKDVLELIDEIKITEQVISSGWEDKILNQLKARIKE